jgi:hypothetical protein
VRADARAVCFFEYINLNTSGDAGARNEKCVQSRGSEAVIGSPAILLARNSRATEALCSGLAPRAGGDSRCVFVLVVCVRGDEPSVPFQRLRLPLFVIVVSSCCMSARAAVRWPAGMCAHPPRRRGKHENTCTPTRQGSGGRGAHFHSAWFQ